MSRSNSTERNVAQRRWRLLARALTRSPDPLDDDEALDEEISVRRFSSFELIQPVHIEDEDNCSWWLYTTVIDSVLYEIFVSHVTKCFTPSELSGFNNTGNVCVWPSEECLAYYLLKNPEICRKRKILELGGGMSCLAGVLTAKYCEPSSVTLTDGNVTCVENVSCIVERNGLAELARCAVVQWSRAAKALRQSASNTSNNNNNNNNNNNSGWPQDSKNEVSYDVILCADCLFFDEVRLDLVDTIYGWLAENGIALAMAPRRGTTFRKFAEAAKQRGLNARQVDCYDTEVWARHLRLLETNRDYCPDLHYPVLLEITKQQKIGPG